MFRLLMIRKWHQFSNDFQSVWTSLNPYTKKRWLKTLMLGRLLVESCQLVYMSYTWSRNMERLARHERSFTGTSLAWFLSSQGPLIMIAAKIAIAALIGFYFILMLSFYFENICVILYW